MPAGSENMGHCAVRTAAAVAAPTSFTTNQTSPLQSCLRVLGALTMGFGRIAVRQLMLLALASSLLTPAAAAVGAVHPYVKPGSHCADMCGNISIPYPFGMGGPECYLNERFKIRCDPSSGPPKPFLDDSNIEVAEIRPDVGQLRIMKFIARDCYARNGSRLTKGSTLLHIEGLAGFTINDTRNRLTAVGCDTYAIVKGSVGNHNYTTGCISLCESRADVTNGSCNGVGCCRISIPEGLDRINITVDSYNNHREVWDFSPCSYASVVEKDSFNFSSTYLKSLMETEKLPMVLDWVIEINKTCETAQRNRSSYACGENADCHQPKHSTGYRCKCRDGYEGNPYLHNGCKDVDECLNSTLHDCDKFEFCRNQKGNYTCVCPKGLHGDGRKDGERCSPNRSHVVEITLGTGMSILILILAGFGFYFERGFTKLKQKYFEQNGGLILKEQLSQRSEGSPFIKIFTAEEIKKATDNYDKNRKIGQGAFGTVYKGLLIDGTVVAVKKSQTVYQSQVEQFINEIVVISKIKHKSVVKLLGCCLEAEVPLLVYEFINNGTLSDHLHNRNKKQPMTWAVRLKIAVETAIALAYMHNEASTTPIIHRDIKCDNILLDDDYNVKLSDFGISRLVPMDHNQLSTMVMGTLGYLDPEYYQTSYLTEKSDVYSFGVVLVELLTAKEALSFDRPEMERNLASLFILSMKEDRLFEILDDHVVTEGNLGQLKEMAELAKRCLREQGEDRPTMREVARELERINAMVHHYPRVGNNLNVQGTTQEIEPLVAEGLEAERYGGSHGSEVGGFGSTEGIPMSQLDGGR